MVGLRLEGNLVTNIMDTLWDYYACEKVYNWTIRIVCSSNNVKTSSDHGPYTKIY